MSRRSPAKRKSRRRTAGAAALSAGRRSVAAFMNRLYRQRLTTTSGGNLSLRLPDGTILITPSATDKGRMEPAQIGRLAPDGTNLTPRLKPSIEAGMHLAIYRRHPKVQAIVHAHPVAASVFTVSRRRLDCRLLAESYAIIGAPVVARYALMGTAELAAVTARALDRGVCVLMRNHGVLTAGRNLLEAFDRLEVLENAARLNLYAQLLGAAGRIPPRELACLDQLMGRA